MKKIIVLLAIICFSLFSQTEKDPPNFEFGIGPSIGIKSSVSYIETPEGRQNGMAFAKLPAFGLNTFIPLSRTSRIGFEFDLGYETYSYLIKEYESGDKYVQNHGYFVVNPNFYFANFLFGFNIGVPLAADYEDVKIDTDIMNTSVEIVVGGMFNIYNDETGRFNFFIKAQYMLTGVYDDFTENDPLLGVVDIYYDELKESENPKLASLMIGFNYMFNLTKRNVEE